MYVPRIYIYLMHIKFFFFFKLLIVKLVSK